MSETPFDKLEQLAHDHASMVLIGKKGQAFGEPESTEMLTFFHLIKRDGSWDVVATPWANDKEKRELILNVCLHILKEDVVAYSFVSEVWTAKGTKEETEQKRRIGLPPRLRPDRQEAVVCLMGDAKEQHFKSWEIVRDENLICTALKPVPDGLSFQSWIADALQKAILVNEHDSGRLREKLKEFLP